jgi:hypothetical protein
MNTHNEAEARRTAGMTRAISKAEKDRAGWANDALECVRRFCAAHDRGFEFLTEDVREYAEALQLIEAPENARAWGSVMQNAARAGYIKKSGYAPARSSNLAPKVLWMVN